MFDLHRDLVATEPHHRHTSIRFSVTAYQQSKGIVVGHIRAIARAVNHEATEVCYKVAKQGTHLVMVKMILLAQVIEREAVKGCRVTLAHVMPGDMQERVEQLRKEKRAMHHEGKVFESVVARTQVEKQDPRPTTDELESMETTEDDLIPAAYPISATISGIAFVTGSLRDNSLKRLKATQEEEYRARTQIRQVLGPSVHAQQVSLEHSAATAGVLHGVHYESELTATQSNKLVRLKTGTELKSSTHVYCAQCPEGVVLTLTHLTEHVTIEDLHAAADELERIFPKCITCSTKACCCKGTGIKFGKLDRTVFHSSMALGFLHKNLLQKPKHPSDIKEYNKLMKKTSAAFAMLGLAEYKRSNPKCEPDLTPDTLPEPLAEEEAKKHRYQAYVDASVHETRLGPWIVGLGGFIQEGEGNVLEEFSIRKEVPRGTSATHAEHLASLVLAKLALRLKLQDVAFLADNNAVPNQIQGTGRRKGS